nr:hypothetical protein CFP56_53381 [Quercus suber]
MGLWCLACDGVRNVNGPTSGGSRSFEADCGERVIDSMCPRHGSLYYTFSNAVSLAKKSCSYIDMHLRVSELRQVSFTVVVRALAIVLRRVDGEVCLSERCMADGAMGNFLGTREGEKTKAAQGLMGECPRISMTLPRCRHLAIFAGICRARELEESLFIWRSVVRVSDMARQGYSSKKCRSHVEPDYGSTPTKNPLVGIACWFCHACRACMAPLCYETLPRPSVALQCQDMSTETSVMVLVYGEQ